MSLCMWGEINGEPNTVLFLFYLLGQLNGDDEIKKNKIKGKESVFITLNG